MEKNNPRFYYALGALSLFALALFQGAQFFTNQYESQVLGWTSIFQNSRQPNTGGTTLPNYQKLKVPSIPPIPSTTSLPPGFQMNQWQSYMGNKGDQSIRNKLGLGKGISCTAAMELFDTLCTDDTITKEEFGQTRDDYIAQQKEQTASQDPRDSQVKFLGQHLPSGAPSRQPVPAFVAESVLDNKNSTDKGLSCNNIKALLDDQTVCADGSISREEIRALIISSKDSLKPSSSPSKVAPTGITQELKQCTLCGSSCSFIKPGTRCLDIAPEPGTQCAIQNGACVKVKIDSGV